MVKCFGRVYRNIQQKCPYPSPNTTSSVPPRLLFTSQHDSTNDCGVTENSHKQPSPVPNLTTTNQVDTDNNNDDDTNYVATPIKHNHSTPEITETTATANMVQDAVNSRLFQMSPSTSTTSLKLSPYVK